MGEQPVVFIIRPSANAVVRGTTIIQVGTGSEDVDSLELYIDGFALPGSPRTSPPWELPWETTRWFDGAHQIVVRAYGAAGQVGRAEIFVQVENAAKAES